MAFYAHHVPEDPNRTERLRRQKLDDQLKAIEAAQGCVATHLGIWLRAAQHPEGAKQAKQAWSAMDEARRLENELFMKLFISMGVHPERYKYLLVQ